MKNKRQDPMPPPDATPEEIGEFWDTHSLADYWDETHEIEFQVNLKSEAIGEQSLDEQNRLPTLARIVSSPLHNVPVTVDFTKK